MMPTTQQSQAQGEAKLPVLEPGLPTADLLLSIRGPGLLRALLPCSQVCKEPAVRETVWGGGGEG